MGYLLLYKHLVWTKLKKKKKDLYPYTYLWLTRFVFFLKHIGLFGGSKILFAAVSLPFDRLSANIL